MASPLSPSATVSRRHTDWIEDDEEGDLATTAQAVATLRRPDACRPGDQTHDQTNLGSAHPLLLKAASLCRLKGLAPECYRSASGLVGVGFEEVVALGRGDHRVLFSAEACNCIIIAARAADGARVMAHKRLDIVGSIDAFVHNLIGAISLLPQWTTSSGTTCGQNAELSTTEYVVVGGHDDTRELVGELVETIDKLSGQRWKLTHRQLFGREVTRSLAMTSLQSDSVCGKQEGRCGPLWLYEVDFSALPRPTQRCFRLAVLLAADGISAEERDGVTASLKQERDRIAELDLTRTRTADAAGAACDAAAATTVDGIERKKRASGSARLVQPSLLADETTPRDATADHYLH